MAHFYGQLKGSRGETTRCGTRISGIWAKVKSWDSTVQVTLSDQDGVDKFDIEIYPINGADQSKISLVINGEEFVYYKGKIYKERHQVLGEML